MAGLSMMVVLMAAQATVPPAASPAPSPPPLSGTISKEQAEAALAKCGSRRFETSAEGMISGKVRRTRLDLCATDAETQAEWIAKLEKSIAAVRAQAAFSAEVKAKLVGDLSAEIARLRPPQPLAPVRADIGVRAPVAPPLQPTSDFRVSALPPMPSTKVAPAGPASLSAAAAATTATRKPRLSIQCAIPGGKPGRCGFMASDESLFVTAEEDLGSPVTLRFRRVDGKRDAEVQVRRLAFGQSATVNVPKVLCDRVSRARFEVQIVGAGPGGVRYEDVQGPFSRRC